ncbi:carbohydrate ABC transporter permease [Ruminococcus flavefaciens]|uniref:Oligogalacturonide transport system permease protein n=1 Tax=Ruminococcus flavefaciens TaxID=1265 RepID=A0A1M7HZ31_RUMFL|nr:sugar ABC transporter permease [Ruminococcus flavefaciens]SHM33397.1 oligogalacturonide transport system permease protein [Ruminococcus flavefaciens]
MRSRIYRNPVGVSKFTGLVLILPFIIGAVLFIIYPFVYSFTVGLTDNNGGMSFENYRNILSDSSSRQAFGVTLKYTLILVPLKLAVSLLVALLLNCELKGIGIFRTAFYIPSILGSNLAVIIMWQYLFTSDGLVNQLLSTMGIAPVGWYGDPDAALFIIVLLRLWEFGSTMVIFLAALRDMPKELYDAAKVDGCGNIRTFFSITLPQLKRIIFINLILQTIAAMQEFNAPYMITGGGPLGNTRTIGMYIYEEMFRYGDEGTANAVSWLLFVIIGLIVMLLYKFTEKLRRD